MKYSFVILHYNENTLPDTYECVESIIENADVPDFQIVVVENGSDDSSLSELKQQFDDTPSVSIISSKINLGFACGNNLGCDFAISKWNPEFLIVINNDTVIKQSSFLSMISAIYKQYHFHILGPNIRDKNNLPQNPVGTFPLTVQELDQGINGLGDRLCALNKSYLKYWLKFKGVKVLKRRIKKALLQSPLRTFFNKASKRDVNSLEVQEGVGLHGAALIFSKDYYRKYENVFYPETFMYKEEDILYYRIKNHNLVSLYHPNLIIHHKEDQSTDSSMKGGSKKEKFILENQLNSFKVYKDYILKDQSLKNPE